MQLARPKLTRRRGACESCRQRKVRCDGARPCSYCERYGSRCEYSRTRRAQSMPHSQSSSRDDNAPAEPNVTQTPNNPSENAAASSEVQEHVSQMASGDSTYSDVLDFENEFLYDASVNETLGKYFRNDTRIAQSGVDFFNWNFHQAQSDESTAVAHNPPEFPSASSSYTSILVSLHARLIIDEQKTNDPASKATSFLANTLQDGDPGSHRRVKAAKLVDVLLSFRSQLSVFDILLGSKWTQREALDFSSIPMVELVKRAFLEPVGPNLFFKESDVISVQQNLLDPGKPCIHVNDMAMLMVTLGCGALARTDGHSATAAVLVDAIHDIAKLLPQQEDSIKKFLALVATLYLMEKINSPMLPAILSSSVSTAASLRLHSEASMRSYRISVDQRHQVERAVCLLYCIEKLYALRWNMFSLLGDDFHPPSQPTTSVLGRTAAETSEPPDLLHIRCQYAQICSRILRFRVQLKHSDPIESQNDFRLLTAELKMWYDWATDQYVLSSNGDLSLPHQLRYSYDEALLHLSSASLFTIGHGRPALSKEELEVCWTSVYHPIMSCNEISLKNLLQDMSRVYAVTLAVCLLSVKTFFCLDDELVTQSQALLNIACGFFARISLMAPGSSVPLDALSLIDSLKYH